MSLSEERLRGDLEAAMRARDGLRTRVLRGLLAAVKNKSIESRGQSAKAGGPGQGALGEKELVAIVKREAKQCAETLDYARKADREDAVAEHESVLAVLESYLPTQLGEEELRSVVAAILDETGAASIGDVMKELSARHGGSYDGKLASSIVREALGS